MEGHGPGVRWSYKMHMRQDDTNMQHRIKYLLGASLFLSGYHNLTIRTPTSLENSQQPLHVRIGLPPCNLNAPQHCHTATLTSSIPVTPQLCRTAALPHCHATPFCQVVLTTQSRHSPAWYCRSRTCSLFQP